MCVVTLLHCTLIVSTRSVFLYLSSLVFLYLSSLVFLICLNFNILEYLRNVSDVVATLLHSIRTIWRHWLKSIKIVWSDKLMRGVTLLYRTQYKQFSLCLLHCWKYLLLENFQNIFCWVSWTGRVGRNVCGEVAPCFRRIWPLRYQNCMVSVCITVDSNHLKVWRDLVSLNHIGRIACK